MGAERRSEQPYEELATREEAEALRAQRAAEDPGGTWFTFETATGTWAVGRVDIKPAPPATGATTEARPRPPDADDPRPASFRNVPPWGAGGG
jgi:hypothetical protein